MQIKNKFIRKGFSFVIRGLALRETLYKFGCLFNPRHSLVYDCVGCDAGWVRTFIPNWGRERDKYLSLLVNLDHESVATVHQILARMERVRQVRNKKYLTRYVDLWSDEEKKILAEKRCVMESIPLEENAVFAWRGFLLPVSRFEIGIFLERLSIGRYINTELVEKANIVDVGAYVGDSSLLFSKLTSGKVYAFEPIEAHFKLLNKTVALNKLTNVVPVKLGLGAKNYETEIVLQGAGSSLVLKKSCREVEKIEIRSLDDFISENKLQVGLIKVDIEGAERDFLKGAEKTIRAQRPILIISIYHSAEDFFTIKPMIDGWGCGYSFRIWKPLDGYILADTCLIAVSDNGNPHGGMQ